jgi:hypothetical protein
MVEKPLVPGGDPPWTLSLHDGRLGKIQTIAGEYRFLLQQKIMA